MIVRFGKVVGSVVPLFKNRSGKVVRSLSPIRVSHAFS
jgi:hypothetical protein